MTRHEDLRVVLALDPAAAATHAADLTLFTNLDTTDKAVTVTYTYWVQYYGQVQAHLEALTRLIADPAVVVAVSEEELRYGCSVLADWHAALSRCLTALEDRHAD